MEVAVLGLPNAVIESYRPRSIDTECYDSW